MRKQSIISFFMPFLITLTIIITVLSVIYCYFETTFPIAGPAVGLVGCIIMIPANIITNRKEQE